MRWLPYVYQYSIMIIVFSIGIYFGIKGNILDPKTTYGKKYLVILISGLLLMMVIQAFLQFIIPVL